MYQIRLGSGSELTSYVGETSARLNGAVTALLWEARVDSRSSVIGEPLAVLLNLMLRANFCGKRRGSSLGGRVFTSGGGMKCR